MEVIEGLDLRAMTAATGAGRGVVPSAAAGPYSLRRRHRGVFQLTGSVRLTDLAECSASSLVYEDPNDDTIAIFAAAFLKKIQALVVQVHGVARETGALKPAPWALMGVRRSMPTPAVRARRR